MKFSQNPAAQSRYFSILETLECLKLLKTGYCRLKKSLPFKDGLDTHRLKSKWASKCTKGSQEGMLEHQVGKVQDWAKDIDRFDLNVVSEKEQSSKNRSSHSSNMVYFAWIGIFADVSLISY